MSSRYLDMMSRNRRRGNIVQLTARGFLTFVSVVGMAASLVNWGFIQLELTENWAIAIASAVIIVIAPPAIISFIIPWSPGGMLLQKIKARTWGHYVVILCGLFFIWYVFDIQYSWWASQPVVKDTGLILHQVGLWIICSVIIPGVLLAQVTDYELIEAARQAHIVKRYELQTQADIAILRSQMLRARQLSLKGFSNLLVEEKAELATVLSSLVQGINSTLEEYNQGVQAVSETVIPFRSLEDNEEIQEYLDFVSRSIMSSGRRNRQQRREDDDHDGMV
jgi:hypothetical protein